MTTSAAFSSSAIATMRSAGGPSSARCSVSPASSRPATSWRSARASASSSSRSRSCPAGAALTPGASVGGATWTSTRRPRSAVDERLRDARRRRRSRRTGRRRKRSPACLGDTQQADAHKPEAGNRAWQDERAVETMRAIRKRESAPGLTLDEVPVPTPGPDEVLVRIEAASICGTDLHIQRWDQWSSERVEPPLTLGHELCGTVVATGDAVRDFDEGDFVSAESHVTCGVCFHCRTGKAHMCEQTQILGVDRDGGFADYAAIPSSVVWRNDRTKLPPEIACLQEPFGNAVFATSTQDLAGRAVAVLGCGPVGSLHDRDREGVRGGEALRLRPRAVPDGARAEARRRRGRERRRGRRRARLVRRAERRHRRRRGVRDVRGAARDRGRVRDRPARRQRRPLRDPAHARRRSTSPSRSSSRT